jgi:hypothetical protein
MSNQQELREWLKVVSVVAIPVVVVIMGAIFAKSNATREVNAKMVEIAAQVLTGPPTDSTQAVRRWAVEVLKHYSEVPFSASAESTFRGFTLPPIRRLAGDDPSLVPVRLIISPRIATVPPGTIQDFLAVAYTSAGDTAGAAMAWSAKGGTIGDTSSSGGRHYARFRADNVPGEALVVVRFQQLADTALVRVRP